MWCYSENWDLAGSQNSEALWKGQQVNGGAPKKGQELRTEAEHKSSDNRCHLSQAGYMLSKKGEREEGQNTHVASMRWKEKYSGPERSNIEGIFILPAMQETRV